MSIIRFLICLWNERSKTKICKKIKKHLTKLIYLIHLPKVLVLIKLVFCFKRYISYFFSLCFSEIKRWWLTSWKILFAEASCKSIQNINKHFIEFVALFLFCKVIITRHPQYFWTSHQYFKVFDRRRCTIFLKPIVCLCL